MPRIETYPDDQNLQDGDKWIGTDQTGNVTRNYSLRAVLDFIVDQSTGNVVVNNPDQEDITVLANKLKFKDRDAIGFQKGYKIIRADFDWSTAPASYANSIWEIRYEFDLLGAAIVLPDNVCLKFNGGFIRNYTSITALNGKSTVNEAEGFDGSGTIDATWVFGEIFDTDDRIKLDGIEAGATKSDLAYNGSPTQGIVTNTGGTDATLPLSNPTNAGLLPPINTLVSKPSPVGADALILSDSENSNNYKRLQISDLPVQSGTANLSYTPSSTNGTVVSDTGTNAILPAGSTTNASLMLPGDKTKLNSISSSAEQNVQSNWNATSGDSFIQNKPQVLERISSYSNVTFFSPGTINLLHSPNIITPLFCNIVGTCTVANNGYAIGEKITVLSGAINEDRSAVLTNMTLSSSVLRTGTSELKCPRADSANDFVINYSQWVMQITLWGYRF
jgi:hypothetical protein